MYDQKNINVMFEQRTKLSDVLSNLRSITSELRSYSLQCMTELDLPLKISTFVIKTVKVERL